jgi:polysaccharide biosynthesis transport protein
MKTKEYFAPLLKWWWLLLIAMIVAGVSAYFTTRPLPPVYQATTTLVIGRFINSLNPTQDEMYLSQQLAQTYADIAGREPMRLATMKALGLNDLPNYTARPGTSGPFLNIIVTYSDPKVAQAVANELANQLILLSPANLKQSDSETSAFLDQQMKDVRTKISKTQDEIVQKQQELSTLTSAAQISQAQAELDALDTRLTSLQTIYSNMQTSLPQSARNQLSIYESAGLPRRPIGPNKPLIISLAAIAGLILAGIAAYSIEALDTSVKSSEEVTRVLDLPVIGRVSIMGGGKRNWTYVLDQPHSPVAEDFRMLRTNLEFFEIDQPIKTFMVSSADVGDGKSTIAANLAQVMALGEKSVVLVDADFRRPMVANAFELDEAQGLSDVISHNLHVRDLLIPWSGNAPLNLSILPAGTLPPNPTELLSSMRMERVFNELKEIADIVIFDGPPFIVADASILASKMDGLLLVVCTGHTHRAAIQAMHDQLKRINAHVLGLVFNQTKARTSYYASKYNTPDRQKKKQTVAKETSV